MEKEPTMSEDVQNKDRSHFNPLSLTKKDRRIFRGISIGAFVALIVLTVLISSIMGAAFGLVAGSFGSVVSSKISQRISKYFPGLQSQQVYSQVSKQQILVEDSAVTDVVQKSTPAVVSIIISKNIRNQQNLFNPFDFPDVPSPQSQQGLGNDTQQQVGGGTGFFISDDGMILTNRHVVEDQQASYMVVTNDGKQYPAKVLARDPVRDVAVIKIDGSGFPILPLGNSDSLQIGQTTIAVGNSLGEFTNSVSRGIVSGLKRNVNAGSGLAGDTERLTDIIQTDAAINPGNSGGPLIDINGNVIGINVARAQGAEGIGFALPINQAKRLVDQVKSGAQIKVPFLGVRYIAIDPLVQQQAQLPFDYGVLVLRGNAITDLAVIPGSPADKAGITENDIILEVNGEKITSDNQLGDIVAKYNVGDTLTLKVWHKGNTTEVKVTLEEKK